MMVRRSRLAAGAAMAVLTAVEPAAAQKSEGISYVDLPRGAYAVVAEVRAKPGKADALRAITLPLVAYVSSGWTCSRNVQH